jgi:hypothetical protein
LHSHKTIVEMPVGYTHTPLWNIIGDLFFTKTCLLNLMMAKLDSFFTKTHLLNLMMIKLEMLSKRLLYLQTSEMCISIRASTTLSSWQLCLVNIATHATWL